MNRLIIIISIFGILNSCSKDRITNYTAIISNSSGTKIRISRYLNGVGDSATTITIEDGGIFKIADDFEYGEIKSPFFITEYLAIEENDSIVVTFNDSFKVVHYAIAPPIHFPLKYYFFESSRNLVNRDNYEFKHQKTKNESFLNTHNYIFTKADYNFAKD